MQNEPQRLSRNPAVTMLVIASAMVAVIGLVSFQSSASRRVAARELNGSREIRRATDDLLSLLKDAETGQRGYLLTGKEIYLGPYKNATAGIPGLIARLRSVTAELPDQAKRVADLQPVIVAKLQELARTIELRRSQGETAAVA